MPNEQGHMERWCYGHQIIGRLPLQEDKLKQLVFKFGAVATGIYASDSSFSNTNKVKKSYKQRCAIALFPKCHLKNKSKIRHQLHPN
jgi:hypothetical protein